jgi:signal transduction histidine kinase
MFAMQGDALAKMADLMNSLLEISKLESGDVDLNVADTPIEDIFQRLQKEFASQAAAKGLQLRFVSDSEVAYLDSKLLTRILRILLSNAIRYTNKGSVDVSCRRESGSLRITVEDSGIGIEPDQLTGIFDEFYRVDKDPAGRSGNLGLGLSIVERSAKLMGTKVEVESEPGIGSRFSIVVPTCGKSGLKSGGATD